MSDNTTHVRIAVDTVLDASLLEPALPAVQRSPKPAPNSGLEAIWKPRSASESIRPPGPSSGLESIWPMDLVVGVRERLTREEAPWERTTRWRVA